ncbi:hypothetical protein GRJ2_000411000 [Grus japonensis]|uniref:Endonuclease/exonuclease/phosphatase domain-containing protein n=1 Tax=Grus japonensis TaxID=30415 RepID=A0ABC9W3S6_GRUJA
MEETHAGEVREGLSARERDSMLEQGNDERSPPPEDEEATETTCDELTVTPIPRPPVPLRGGSPPDQEEDVNKAFYRRLEEASRSQVLVLMGDFNHPDSCWKDNTARHEHSRRFLQGIDDNFLTQVAEEPTRRGVLLDLVRTKKDWLGM